MLLRTWNSQDPYGVFYRHLRLAEGEGGDEGGGAGGGEGTPPPPPPDPKGGGDGKPPAGVPQDKVDEIVKGRLAENSKKVREDLAKQLGVPLEQAQEIIKAHNERLESEKTEAQKAKEAADTAKAQSDAAEAAAKTEKHNAAVERRLVRALPRDLDDEVLDGRVAKMAKLIEVEEGASAEDIDKAIKTLKDDWPEIFGATSNGGSGGSDPKGKPPRSKATDAYKRGEERAKARSQRSAYSFETTT